MLRAPSGVPPYTFLPRGGLRLQLAATSHIRTSPSRPVTAPLVTPNTTSGLLRQGRISEHACSKSTFSETDENGQTSRLIETWRSTIYANLAASSTILDNPGIVSKPMSYNQAQPSATKQPTRIWPPYKQDRCVPPPRVVLPSFILLTHAQVQGDWFPLPFLPPRCLLRLKVSNEFGVFPLCSRQSHTPTFLRGKPKAIGVTAMLTLGQRPQTTKPHFTTVPAVLAGPLFFRFPAGESKPVPQGCGSESLHFPS